MILLRELDRVFPKDISNVVCDFILGTPIEWKKKYNETIRMITLATGSDSLSCTLFDYLGGMPMRCPTGITITRQHTNASWIRGIDKVLLLANSYFQFWNLSYARGYPRFEGPQEPEWQTEFSELATIVNGIEFSNELDRLIIISVKDWSIIYATVDL